MVFKKTIVCITWEDACFRESEHLGNNFVSKIKYLSCGLLAKETEETISIAMSYQTKRDIWKYILHVPKKYILETKYMELDK